VLDFAVIGFFVSPGEKISDPVLSHSEASL
jgi:hypothetical protein